MRDSATGQVGNASFPNKSRKKTEKQVVDEEYTSPVDESLIALRQSVKCGEAWREAYRNAALLQNKSKHQPWEFKESSIFAQIDAFVQHRSGDHNLHLHRPLGDGVVAGHGMLDGRRIVCFAQDYSIFEGTMGEMHAKKTSRRKTVFTKINEN